MTTNTMIVHDTAVDRTATTTTTAVMIVTGLFIEGAAGVARKDVDSVNTVWKL